MVDIRSAQGSVWDYVREQFADDVTARMDQFTVPITDGILLQGSARRWGFLIINTSTQIIRLRFLNRVGSTNGITLTTGGGFFGSDARNDMILPSLPIYARAEVAPGTVDILVIEELG